MSCTPSTRRSSTRPGSASHAHWSGRTSPASTWPVARSRCCGPTTTCCGCGTTRSTPQLCEGDADLTNDTVAVAALTSWIREFGRVINENAQLLSDLDAAIGDADHGINMQRGMTAVLA